MAPSFLSHPYVSPFDHAMERHFNSDGLWFRNAVSHFSPEARYFTSSFQVEWLKSRVRSRRGSVGDDDAAFRLQDGFGAGTVSTPDALLFRVTFPFQMGNVPDISLDGVRLGMDFENRDGWGFGIHGTWSPEAFSDYDYRREVEKFNLPYFNALNLQGFGGIGNPQIPNNLRLISDQDIVENDILNRSPLLFDTADVEDFGAYGLTSDILERALLVPPTLPLQNGVNVDGIYQFFDLDFNVRQQIETYSAGAHLISGALFNRHGIEFRGVVGGRYLHVNESFHLRGTDSGLGYTFPAGAEGHDRIDNDGDFLVDEIDEGGGGGPFTPGSVGVDQILVRSFVDSFVSSDIGGPEIGLAYQLIGERGGFNVSGSTRGGLFLNNETLALQGDNIGDPFNALEMFDTSTLNGPTQNAFTDRRQTTHVSPMFEQSLTAQIPLFHRVPVLKDVGVLEHANLQLGWTFLFVGEVADPQQSIVWASNPRAGLFPTINIDRANFYQNSFRLGVDWEY